MQAGTALLMITVSKPVIVSRSRTRVPIIAYRGGCGEFVSRGCGDLLAALRAVPDPRPSGARRHPTAYLLGVLVVSFAWAGFETFTGAVQWAAGADRALLLRLGARYRTR